MNTPSDRNPYQPPEADTASRAQDFDAAELIVGGQSVPASNALAWIGSGWTLFAKSPGIWIANILILFVLSLILASIPIIGSIASYLLTPVFIGGLLLGCRSLDTSDTLRVDHLFAGFREKTGQLVLVGLLMLVSLVAIFAVVFVVAIVIFGTGILQTLGNQHALTAWIVERGLMIFALVVVFAIALTIPLVMAYWFAPALVVFHNLDAVSAMKQSFQGCLRNFLAFLLYGFLFLILGIVALIPIGLGLLVIVPMWYAALYASYKDIYLQK